MSSPLNNRAIIPISMLLILIGLFSLLTCGITFLISYQKFIRTGHNLTVPTETVTLDLEPDRPYAIYHRLTGSHITENRPNPTLPDDLSITITDPQAETPPELEKVDWIMRSSVFGLTDRRHAIARFTAPPSGQVSLSVSGLDDETVFYIGRTSNSFVDDSLPTYTAWGIASLLLVVAAAVLILRRLTCTAALELNPSD